MVSLSGREIEILTLTAEGLKRDEIALRLHLAAGTVKNHLKTSTASSKLQAGQPPLKSAGIENYIKYAVRHIPDQRFILYTF